MPAKSRREYMQEAAERRNRVSELKKLWRIHGQKIAREAETVNSDAGRILRKILDAVDAKKPFSAEEAAVLETEFKRLDGKATLLTNFMMRFMEKPIHNLVGDDIKGEIKEALHEVNNCANRFRGALVLFNKAFPENRINLGVTRRQSSPQA